MARKFATSSALLEFIWWIAEFLICLPFPCFWYSGIYIINLGKTWEKLQMAARVIVAIENPGDIIVQSARPYGQRAVLKFAKYTHAHAIAGRHTPGTFTNQMQTSFNEPRLLILTDPRTDHQVSIVLYMSSSLVFVLFLLFSLLPIGYFLHVLVVYVCIDDWIIL